MKTWIWMLLALGLAVRVSGLMFGLPFSYDEQEQRLVNIALKIGATRSLDTQFVLKGVLPWILVVEYGVYYALGRAVGWFDSAVDFAKSFFVDASAFYMIDRLNQAAAAVVCLWFVYRLGEKMLGPSGGLWALALGAVSAFHVTLSRYANVDLWNALFATLAYVKLADYDRTATWRSIGWASFWCAASAAAKLTGGVVLVGILGMALVRRQFAHAALAACVFVLGFFLLTPPLWVAPVWNVKAVVSDTLLRSATTPTGGGLWNILGMVTFDILSIPGLVALAAGLAMPYGSSAFKWIGLVLPTALITAFVVKMAPSSAYHYFMVVWPVLILLPAAGLLRFSAPVWKWGIGGLILASQLFFLPANFSEVIHPRFSRPVACMSYDQAKGVDLKQHVQARIQSVADQVQFRLQPLCTYEMIGWIRSNVPRGTKLAVMEGGTWKGRLFPMPDEIRERLQRFDTLPPNTGIDYNLGNRELYQWLLRIVESDASVPAYRITNLDISTTADRELMPRRSALVWIEDVRPYETWSDLKTLDADYFLFIDWPDRFPERFRTVQEQLERIGPPVVVHTPFKLYRLSPQK